MRHSVFGRKLNRNVKQRKALFKSLVEALIIHGKIRTTEAKAKAIRGLVEKLVTHAKEGSTSALRAITSVVTRQDLITKLTKEIAPRFSGRAGGYSKLIRLGRRVGDQTKEVYLKWSVEEEIKKPESGKRRLPKPIAALESKKAKPEQEKKPKAKPQPKVKAKEKKGKKA
jgi:large subunit ribosomal protein L17